MPRDLRLNLDDILDAIAHIRENVKGLDYETFQRDRKTGHEAFSRRKEIYQLWKQ